MAGQVRPEEITRDKTWSRRDFLHFAGWGGVLGGLGIGTLGFLRFMYPRVSYDPPTRFKAGPPSDYLVGEISERWKKEKRVWVGRTTEGVFALFGQCTHLGCTPNYLKAEDKFKCPCHGSGFKGIGAGSFGCGINFEGPAPRPLERCTVTLQEGQIVIDFGTRFKHEKGEWEKPQSFART
jgi:cytochrome b6-f complex iron-sulfur subunit